MVSLALGVFPYAFWRDSVSDWPCLSPCTRLVASFPYAFWRDSVSDTRKVGTNDTGHTCFHTPFGVTLFRTTLSGKHYLDTLKFPYAFWRDSVSDWHASTGVCNKIYVGFPYAFWRDSVSDMAIAGIVVQAAVSIRLLA